MDIVQHYLDITASKKLFQHICIHVIHVSWYITGETLARDNHVLIIECIMEFLVPQHQQFLVNATCPTWPKQLIRIIIDRYY